MISVDFVRKSEKNQTKINDESFSIFSEYSIFSLLDIDSPYCAAIIINNSAQHSSSKTLWSHSLIWLNVGIDLAHLTAKNSNLAADSNTASCSDNELLNLNDGISSELETSSSLATTAVDCRMVVAVVDVVDVVDKVPTLVIDAIVFVIGELTARHELVNALVTSWTLFFRISKIDLVGVGWTIVGKFDDNAPFEMGLLNIEPTPDPKWSDSKKFGWSDVKCG